MRILSWKKIGKNIFRSISEYSFKFTLKLLIEKFQKVQTIMIFNILVLIAAFALLSQNSFSEVKVALREPLKFKVVRVGSDYDGSIIAEGIIEVMAEEEDFGKGIKFEMPELSFMTNGKNWIKIDKLVFDQEQDKFLISKSRTFVRFYGIISRDNLEKNSRRDLLEGAYEGDVPVVYSVYHKKN